MIIAQYPEYLTFVTRHVRDSPHKQQKPIEQSMGFVMTSGAARGPRAHELGSDCGQHTPRFAAHRVHARLLEWQELPLRRIVGKHFAGFDLVDPGVQADAT